MMSYGDKKMLLNNGLDNSLLPDGTKPLSELMLTQDYWCSSQSKFPENVQNIMAQFSI